MQIKTSFAFRQSLIPSLNLIERCALLEQTTPIPLLKSYLPTYTAQIQKGEGHMS